MQENTGKHRMSEINYKEVSRHLGKQEGFPPVCLIHGEELLCKTAFNEILDALIPFSERSVNYEPVDNDNVYEAIERVNTFSLLPGKKVVSLCDSQIFYSKQNEESFLEKAKDACDAKDMKKAAKYLTSLMGVSGLSFEDIADKTERNKIFSKKLSSGKLLENDRWLDETIAYCTDNGLSVSAVPDNAGGLQKAVEKGFPENHHLIVTTDIADKRRGLFKAMNKNGLVIDCVVPRGNLRADKMAQSDVLNERMKSILSKSGKTMDRNAYGAMYEMIGFDLRTFSSNLEKLVNYVGERKKITLADVESILRRTKKDPIYELTNAVSERNVGDAFFFLASLLSAGFFPLQALSAISNQIRKVLLAKDFADSPRGKKVWNSRMTYANFQTAVMPEIQKYDEELLSCLEKWGNMLAKKTAPDTLGTISGGKKKKAKKEKAKPKPSTDLLMMKNPRSPYPVYLMMKKSEKFTSEELIRAIESLSETDMKLKTANQNPKLVLEEVILRICRRA